MKKSLHKIYSKPLREKIDFDKVWFYNFAEKDLKTS